MARWWTGWRRSATNSINSIGGDEHAARDPELWRRVRLARLEPARAAVKRGYRFHRTKQLKKVVEEAVISYRSPPDLRAAEDIGRRISPMPSGSQALRPRPARSRTSHLRGFTETPCWRRPQVRAAPSRGSQVGRGEPGGAPQRGGGRGGRERQAAEQTEQRSHPYEDGPTT